MRLRVLMPGSRLSTMAFERRPADDEEVMTTTANDDDDEEVADDKKMTASLSSKAEEGGDDLTSLTWLQNRNLLQGCIAVGGTTTTAAAATSGAIAQRGPIRQPHPLLDGGGGSDESQRCHHHYNPTVHVCSKPPYSFSCLIFMAIEDSPNRALPVKDIYSWILAHFPYFQNAPTGWKNSVRHNLSLNKCFLKVDKGQNIAKGSLWCVDPEHRPNLLQALRKTPFKPFIRLPSDTPAAASAVNTAVGVDHLGGYAPVFVAAANANRSANLLNPVLFPYLSRRLTTATTMTTTSSSPTEDVEVDAAATMLSLKNGPRLLRDRSAVNGEGGSRSRRKREDADTRGRPSGGDGLGKTSSALHVARERRHDSRLYGVPKVDHERYRHHHQQQYRQPSVIVSNGNSPHADDHTYSSSSTTNSPVRATNSGESPSSSIDEPFEFGGIATSAASAAAAAAVVNGNNNDNNAYERDDGFYPSPPTSGGDSGVMRSSSSSSDDDEEEDEDDRRPRRPKSVRCPVIVHTVTTASGHRRVLVENDEERMKIVEGADALLNLAGFSSRRAAADGTTTTTISTDRVAVDVGVERIRHKRKPSRRHLRHLLPTAALKARR